MPPVIKYSFALDEKDRLVDIDTLNRQMRESGELGRFTCPGCNREMRVALGEKNRHYFAHEANGCGTETYLHQLTKIRLLERFESGEGFFVGLLHDVVCSEYKTCPLFTKTACIEKNHRRYDLNKLYDTCSLEERVPSIQNPRTMFVADVLLSDSKSKYPPILLEVLVSHNIGEKKADDGQLVIELPVQTEEDAVRFSSGEILEPECLVSSRGELRQPRFYGPFKHVSSISEGCLERKIIVRTIIDAEKIESTGVEARLTCVERWDRMSNSSFLEMNFDAGSIRDWNRGHPDRMAYVFAVKNGIPVPESFSHRMSRLDFWLAEDALMNTPHEAVFRATR